MQLRRGRRVAALALLALVPGPADAFIEDLFGQAFGGGGGGGGGQQFHFNMGGGQMFQMGGGGGQKRKKAKWPSGVPTKIDKSMSWMKGTEWNWNSWRNVKFEKDGKFDAPTQECHGGQCKWSAKDNKVFILWGEAGLHELNLVGTAPEQQDQQKMQGLKLKGHRVSDREKCTAVFQRIFDFEAAELEKDLYGILGLPDDADEAEIKKVYRKLSIKYHPDKNPDEESRKKFNDVRDAHEILNDADKKILYDTGGMEAVKKHEKGEVQKGEDMGGKLDVNLEDLYNGGSAGANVQRRVVCRGCRVRPDSPNCKACQRCPNEIKVVPIQVGPGMIMQQEQEVPSKEKCKQEDAVIDVQIEKGMSDGETLTYPRMSEQRPGMLPGNVILTLKAKKHPKFERRGDDLHLKMQVTLREALLGWSQTIRHLDGHSVEVGTSSVTKPFQVFKIAGQGMPLRDDPSSFGDLYVKVEVVFPKTLTDAQRQGLEGVFEPSPPRSEL